MSDDGKVRFTLLSGKDAADPDNIIKMFEFLKGRPATPEELAEFRASQPPQEPGSKGHAT